MDMGKRFLVLFPNRARMKAVDLNDAEALRAIDKHGMLDLYLGIADNVAKALELARELEFPEAVGLRTGEIRYSFPPDGLVVTGMGGSAIGGKLLRDLLRDSSKAPIITCEDYHLPSYVGPRSLLVAISYSGNTEETLSAFVEGLKRRCMTVGIASGGLLGWACQELGLPFVRVPSGFPPRAALPYLFLPLLAVADRAGIADVPLIRQAEDLPRLLGEMARELGPDVPVEENKAKELARTVMGTIPVVYGFGPFCSVALRLKTQFNENSKVLSFCNCLPGLDHDEIMGWEGELTDRFTVIFLRDREEDRQMRLRIEATKELIEEAGPRVVELWARGSSRLEKMFSLIYLGDMASIYLALARGIDPYELRSIQAVKLKMAEAGLLEELKKEISLLRP